MVEDTGQTVAGRRQAVCRTAEAQVVPQEWPRPLQIAPGPQAQDLRRRGALCPGLVLAAVGAAAALLGPSQIAGAQQRERPQISVADAIMAAPASQVLLPITVGPPEALPRNSFVRVRGLPPTVSLSEGHAIAPGAWAIPLFALPTLKATIPAGVSERGNVVISLIALDGTLIAEARTVLVIGQPAAAAPAGKRPEGSVQKEAPRPPARPPALTPQDKARAERMLARGEEYLASGNVAAARDFFERAAEIGQAAAALRLAATYDPVELRRVQVQGVVADPAMARSWYMRARELGALEALERLARLGDN
jgi:hypothetical protein